MKYYLQYSTKTSGSAYISPSLHKIGWAIYTNKQYHNLRSLRLALISFNRNANYENFFETRIINK